MPSQPMGDAAMKIECPRCQKILPDGFYDPDRTTILCPHCDYTFFFTTSVDVDALKDYEGTSPPDGISIQRSPSEFILTASARPKSLGLFLVSHIALIIIAVVFYDKYMPETDLTDSSWWLSLLSYVSLLSGTSFYVLFRFWGTYVFTIKQNMAVLRRKLGWFGYSEEFHWSSISAVSEVWGYDKESKDSDNIVHSIMLKGRKTITFGDSLTEAQRAYIIITLRKMLIHQPSKAPPKR
ncbi:MAG: hypothetical protein V1799_09210 [bacterium]